MNCRECQANLVDLIYDEGDTPARADLQAHTDACPACAQALRELRTTRVFLAAWETPTGPTDLSDRLTPPPGARPAPPPAVRREGHARWLLTAAALLLVLTGAMMAVGARVSLEAGRLEISLGRPATPALPPGPGDTIRTVDAMLADSEERQMQRTLEFIQNVYYRLEADRLADRHVLQTVYDLCTDQLERNNQMMEITLQQIQAPQRASTE